MVETSAQESVWFRGVDLVKHYGGVKALRGASIELRPGEVRGIVGPNGAGKSTLVGIIAGLIEPDAGVIEIDGDPASLHTLGAPKQHRVVLMPQRLTVMSDATLTDNITLGNESTQIGRLDRRSNRTRAEMALSAVGLHVSAGTLAGELTLVQQRLLMLARALESEPRLLILDEPTAGLPPEGSRVVLDAVRQLRDHTPVTVLYVSHHLSEVAELCDAVTCVREGRIAGEVTSQPISKKALVELILDAPVVESAKERDVTVGSDAPIAIELRNVTGRRLQDVSFSVRKGEVVGIAGLLGAGSEEIVDVMFGAAKPVSGDLALDGKIITLSSPAAALRQGIGFLGGERNLTSFSDLPIRENVAISALNRWTGLTGFTTKRRERKRVAGPLAELSVVADPERPISTLSGGNQQRALMARLLAAELDIIVLSEPTVGVDIGAREELWAAVRAFADGRAVVVASSEPEELRSLCSTVVCLRKGRLVGTLRGDDITEHAITEMIA